MTDHQPGQEPGRVGYQGSRLHLRVNRNAADELAHVLGDASRDPSLHPMQRRLSLRLPDGRDLEVSINLTDDGDIRDEHGEYVDDDGLAHADISGDFALDQDARYVLDQMARPYPAGVESPDDDAAADQRRLDHALECVRWHGCRPGPSLSEAVVRDIAHRAQQQAEQTREERLTQVHRRHQRRLTAGDTPDDGITPDDAGLAPDDDGTSRRWSM